MRADLKNMFVKALTMSAVTVLLDWNRLHQQFHQKLSNCNLANSPAMINECAGYNDVLDDAKMGWSRYIHSMRVFVFNSGLFYIRPTLASLDLLDRIAYRLDHESGWDQAIFNEVGSHA